MFSGCACFLEKVIIVQTQLTHPVGKWKVTPCTTTHRELMWFSAPAWSTSEAYSEGVT